MRAPVSVIVPTLDAGPELASCVGTLLEGVKSGLLRELVVSDGGSSDATREVARELGAIWVEGPRGRGGQIARGIAASGGAWLLLLHADSQLDPGWSETACRFVSRGSAQAGYFRMRFRAEGIAPRIVASWAHLRSRAFGLPYGDQGLLLPRRLLDEVGGIPDLPLMEDVALARALKGRLVTLPAGISTSAERYERDGWIGRGSRNIGTLARYLLGADPTRLAERYRR